MQVFYGVVCWYIMQVFYGVVCWYIMQVFYGVVCWYIMQVFYGVVCWYIMLEIFITLYTSLPPMWGHMYMRTHSLYDIWFS